MTATIGGCERFAFASSADVDVYPIGLWWKLTQFEFWKIGWSTATGIRKTKLVSFSIPRAKIMEIAGPRLCNIKGEVLSEKIQAKEFVLSNLFVLLFAFENILIGQKQSCSSKVTCA
jgi:hypothetical protein